MVSVHTIVGEQRVITGQSGYYDGKVKDENVRYGRNATHNMQLSEKEFQKNFADLDAEVEIPLDYKYTYSPNGKVNAQALLGTAYEELGAKSVPVDTLTQAVKGTVTRADLKEKASAESLDLNKDGKIDVAEYATSLLTADMLTTNADYNSLSPKDATGEISRTGIQRSLPFFNKDTLKVSQDFFKALYQHWNLGKEQENFFANPNNLVK